MAQTVRCSVAQRLAVTEVADAADFPGAQNDADRTVNHNGFDLSNTLETGTDPDPEAVFSQAYTGTVTIDLTSAPKTGGSTQDLTGKKLIAFQFEAPPGNSGTVTISEGAANGYAIGGNLTLNPGEYRTMSIASGTASPFAAVAAGDKDIDIVAGANTLNVTMVFGGTP